MVRADEFRDWLTVLETALNAREIDAVTELFASDECFWRDLVAFTWNIATMDGRPAIASMLRSQLAGIGEITVVPEGEANVSGDIVEGWFDFETRSGRGKGHVRLRGGKCWTLMTALTELKGFEEPAGRRRVVGIEHKARKDRVTWLEERQRQAASLGVDVQPYCVIVGGGQGGLALGARLKRLGVPTLILEALPKPGDSWRNRYKSLYLHDAVWADHLPYLPFPDHWPVYMSKDKMADWLEMYAKVMELDIWCSTVCHGARYDEAAKHWVVTIEREGRKSELRPQQLVLATGLSGKPQTPSFPGAETFEGVQYHSSEHREGEALAGKRVVVLGANNSAHDICVDLWAAGADVTMIQRSPTTVIKASTLRRNGDLGPWSEHAREKGITTERGDLMVASMPFRPKERIDRANCEKYQREDAVFYDALRACGFMFDFGEDNTGIAGKYARRASGYYIDVGASDLIADGEIVVRSRVGVSAIKPRSVVLSDGSEIPADAIVYATGFGPMESWAEMLISKECSARIGRCWGLGSGTAMDPGPWEGELRNMWKPTAQEGLWFHGGNLAQSRFHSLHLALQIKARKEGLATPVFRPDPIKRG